MNFHAHMVQTLKKTSKATHHSTIVDQVDGILNKQNKNQNSLTYGYNRKKIHEIYDIGH